MEKEKKKINIKIILVIVAIVILAVIGIIVFTSNKGISIFNNETYYHIGDTVSTDIAEFTLNDSQLTIALSNVVDDTYYSPREYDAERDAINPLVAKTGHTFVYVDFTLSAIDRSSISVNDNAYHNGDLYKISYNGKTSKGNFEIGAEKTISSNDFGKVVNGEWERRTNTVAGITISKGGKSQFRGYADIENIENLKDKYYITFKLPNSQGKTQDFTYVINE